MNGLSRIRIKICGITCLEDALCAVEAGVDALGFIFYEKSPRVIAPEVAGRIIARLPPFVDAVGVFVDSDLARTTAIIQDCRLGYAQLHGKESAGYCRDLVTQLPSCRVLKALRVGPHSTAADAAPYRDSVQGFLLDTFDKQVVGGTGATFDWTMIARLRLDKPFLLAGGLDVANIGAALNQVQPYGVDANSGLESAPGRKDHDLIRRFVGLVRRYEAEASSTG
ncbi:phosphoribosylanthranilate isomerase [Desulfobulbus alkaliphilus]|uniref:phosphoribosylanthranilate isomerase n=1 Tax=Desulfobulbus alkaliphilus TaxID=869814 RepID=UPI001965C6B5|nr:phosphoribosylanthranilate isomerase [Desulfobulbus alkaliphilus]MBM9538509.1 phosphoribosylanthranilate isomerase [Desulfobulbus alkaliphilus]